MTVAGTVYSDVDNAVRQWVRDTVPSIERRAFFAPNNAAPHPQIVVWRLPSTDDAALFQCDVWGDTLQQAQDTATELCNAAGTLAHYIYGDARLAGATVERRGPVPDPQSDRPRVVVDITFAGWPTGHPDATFRYGGTY